MPNGGSDCCGTCWFNSKNEDEPGSYSSNKEVLVKCTIRDIEIPDPFWTYCANHPHHNVDKIVLPLGPVYVTDDYPYSRKVWIKPPDNETIRQKLLEILDGIDVSLKKTYPSSTDLYEEVIKQVVELKEKRALPMLLRIAQLDISDLKYIPLLSRNILITIGQAIEALLEISEGQNLSDVKTFIQIGISDSYDQETDRFSVIRYHLVRGLQYCPQAEADDLLKIGTHDPHSEVKAFAVEILSNR